MRYWNFDWEDMGLKDLPASFDYITNLTGVEKLAYVGHSQGTAQMFVALAENEAYFKTKVSIFIALAPVTMIPNTKAAMLEKAAQEYKTVSELFKYLGFYSLMSQESISDQAMNYFCQSFSEMCF